MATEIDLRVVRPIVNPGSKRVTGKNTRVKQPVAFNI